MSFDGFAFVGLNERAKKLVAGDQRVVCIEKVARIFPDGSSKELPDRPVFESTVKQEESGERINDGQWIDRPLMKYVMPDGRVFIEQEQQMGVSDSYGYVLLALRDEEGNWLSVSLWTEGEISKIMVDLRDDQTKINQDGEYWVRPVQSFSPVSARRGRVIGKYVLVGDSSGESIDGYEFLGQYHEGEIAPGVRPESLETEEGVDVSEFE